MSYSEYLNIIIIFGPVSLLMAMTPGPDFTMITQQTIKNGKRGGFLTVIGMATGLLFHALLAGVFTTLIASQISRSLKFVQIFGIIYLFIIGLQSFKTKEEDFREQNHKEGFRSGLIINIFNPKIVIFYLSIVPQFLERHQLSFSNIIFVCSIHIIASIFAMSLLTVFLDQINQRIVKKGFKSSINKACGVIMILFSLYLLAIFLSD